MTVIDGRWPFAARNEEVARITAALGEETGTGVVLVGPTGVGKTMIAQQVVGALSRHFDHIYLRGSATHSTTPYGALNVLLAELDEDTARSPLLVLSALQRMFDGGAAKRRTLVHIDGVEHFDELSATVIAHLARVDVVRLVVTCEDLLRAPEEFFDLWKDNVLERFDIQPLTPDATTELLTIALGAPVSRSAALELWSVSGGNAKYLQMATKADVSSGHLFTRDGIWVSRDVPRPDNGRPVSDWTAAKLAGLPAADRAVVEVLAVAGRLPVALLLKVLPSTSLDALQRNGVVAVEHRGAPLMRLMHGVFAGVVRGQLLSALGKEALEALSVLRDGSDVPAQGTLALAAWALDHGATIDAAELVTLARLANDERIDGAAERFLDALPPTHTASGQVERTRQLLFDGNVSQALDTAEALLGREIADDMPLEDWVDVRLLTAWLRARTHGREQDVVAPLDEVVQHLRQEPEAEGADELGCRTKVVRLELQSFEGEIDRVTEQGSDLLGTRAEDCRWSPRIRSVLSLAHATMGRQEHAVTSMRDVASRSATAPSSAFDRDAGSAHLYGALLMAGYWSEGLSLAGEQGGTSMAVLPPGSPSEFAEGILLAYLGRSSAALDRLIPAISQFRVRDRHGLLPLAEAGAAYAHVLENAPDAAEDHLRAIDLTSRRYSWHLREAVKYFRLLTEAWLDTPEVAAAELMEHALELGGRGYRGIELFFLGQAVQLGLPEAVDVLAASAAASEGPLARLAEDLASALAAHDPGALKEVARQAVDLGNYNLAGDVAAFSIEYLTETDDPMIRVHAEQILRRTSTPARRHVRRKLLSERERAIARKVAQGVPNKEIAQQEHISPRTVEGHVHQIMSKLGLSSRKQLALIFGQQQ